MKTMHHILVVDDTEETLRATSRILIQAGYHVTEAKDGTSCLALMKESLPDLVLLDVQLPDIDGFEVCTRIKNDVHLALAFVVHFSSVRTSSDQQSTGLEGGADGYLVRPIASRELLARIQAFLRHKTTMDELRKALDEVKTLKGLLPICANCKKIRNDLGFWDKIETYLSKYSDVTFSHGMCPECSAKFVEDLKRISSKEHNS